jgi:hypothetical protein
MKKQKKAQGSETKDGTDNSGWQDYFIGSGTVYVIGPGENLDCFVSDYHISAMEVSRPEQMRSKRLACKREEDPVSDISAVELGPRQAA